LSSLRRPAAKEVQIWPVLQEFIAFALPSRADFLSDFQYLCPQIRLKRIIRMINTKFKSAWSRPSFCLFVGEIWVIR
jgi:hypothetical protein